MVARVYNAAASGCRQLHYYTNNVTGSREATENFRAHAKYLKPRKPRVDVAVLVPTEWLALNQSMFSALYVRVAQLRDVVDIDFADPNMIADGALERAHYLIASIGRQYEPETIAAIEEWVNSGGVLIATADHLLATVEGDDAAHRRLFSAPEASVVAEATAPVIVAGEPAESFCLDVGAPWDQPYIGGHWNNQERGAEWDDSPGATKRWSGPTVAAYLPVRTEKPAMLSIEGIVPAHAVGENPVRVNGLVVGKMDSEGRSWEFPVPAGVLATSDVATVELNCRGWSPSDYGQNDRRTLGIAVRSITLTAEGAELAVEGEEPAVRVRMAFDTGALPTCAKRVGQGATLYLPLEWEAQSPTLLAAIAAAIETPGAYAQGIAPIIDVDGDGDSVFWTLCETSALVLNYSDAEVTREFTVREGDLRPAAAVVGKAYSVTVPARSIGEVQW